MNTELKFCKDCKHFQISTVPSQCLSPRNRVKSADLVNGGDEIRYQWVHAIYCRQGIGGPAACGHSAAWFEPHTPIAAQASTEVGQP